MIIRAGTNRDARAVALLHAKEISDGFLATLGPAFLTTLYRRIVRHPDSFLLVADDAEKVTGFVAVTEDLTGLYRAFLIRDGFPAALRAAPRLIRAAHQARETLRYPAGKVAPAQAEILAVAVDATQRGRGLGRALMGAATEQLTRGGVSTARVTAARGNSAALALYRACGFRPAAEVEVHRGAASTVLIWP